MFDNAKDEKDLFEPNEEYKIGGDDYHRTETSESPVSEGSAIKFKPSRGKFKKKFFIILLIISVLYMVFKFIPSKTSKPVVRPSVQQQPEASMLEESKMLSLGQQVGDNTNKINDLQGKMVLLQQNIETLTSSTNNLDAAVRQVATEVQQFGQGSTKKDLLGMKRPAKVIYHVRAIVSGRAWLQAPDGSILTVRPGSKIGAYGTVAVINDADGVVVTDKGVVINYGSNDI